MSDAQMQAIVIAALRVAARAPLKPQRASVYVSVPAIEQLREALEDAGIDWQTACRRWHQ